MINMRLKSFMILSGTVTVFTTLILLIYSDFINLSRIEPKFEFMTDRQLENYFRKHPKLIEDFFNHKWEDNSDSLSLLDEYEEFSSEESSIDMILRPPSRRYYSPDSRYSSSSSSEESYDHSGSSSQEETGSFGTQQYFNERSQFGLSGLGEYLFLNNPLPERRNKTYKILMWMFGEYMEERHLYYFHEQRHDPFAECSVQNCLLTYEDSDLEDADAVLVLLHRLQGVESLPNSTRPAHQRWVFITDESPHNTFNLGQGDWPDLTGIFNWSMTYRAESDVPVPYGRTVPLEYPIELEDSLDFDAKFSLLVPNAEKKRRDVLVAVMMSNCGSSNAREEYIRQLQRYIHVDFYGECGDELKDMCPGSYGDDCPLLDEYLFYLAFENSNCDQYITEKAFHHAYSKGAVPIIMGASSENTAILLPPNSYLHTAHFEKPKDLANTLKFINSTFEDNYLQMHEWRKYMEVVNEHGYFNAPSRHYCRLCEALNYNDEESKIYGYQDLEQFLEPATNCYDL